ncbi:MAG: M13-type metalloendopeptidase [Brevundimonas sp.]
MQAANMRDWWSPASRAAFHARAERVVAQYYGYEPVPGVHLDGRRSLGENLADLVGATLALDALRLRAVEAGMLHFSRRDRLQLQWIGKVAGRRSKGRPITGYLGISGFHPGGGLLVSDPGTFCRSADCIRPLDLAPGVIVSVPLFWRRRRITARLIEDLTKEIHSEAGRLHPN